MTTMAVLYARSTGHALGALTTTVPGELPGLEHLTHLQVPIPTAAGTPPVLTVPVADVGIAFLDAEFDDPVQVFGWRVTSTPGPDGQQRLGLDRPANAVPEADLDDTKLKVTVPRLGSAESLAYQVRVHDRQLTAGSLLFAPAATEQTVSVEVPKQVTVVVLVQGYNPVVVPPEAGQVGPP